MQHCNVATKLNFASEINPFLSPLRVGKVCISDLSVLDRIRHSDSSSVKTASMAISTKRERWFGKRNKRNHKCVFPLASHLGPQAGEVFLELGFVVDDLAQLLQTGGIGRMGKPQSEIALTAIFLA